MMESTPRSETQPGEVTQLLQRFKQGDTEALAQVLPLIYEDLRTLARRYVSSPHTTLQPTALTHELLIYLLEGESCDWQNSEHFFATASLKMRHLLIDYARRKQALKHGGGLPHVTLDEAVFAVTTSARLEEILTVHEMLEEFSKDYPRVAKIVELRFFLGFSEEETAGVLQLSARQVRRDWAFAKGWLELRLAT